MKEHWEKNYKSFMEANKKSTITVEWTKQDKINFIEYCEAKYSFSTREVVAKLNKNGCIGSPDMIRWRKYAKELYPELYA